MANKKVLSIELGVQTTRICEIDFKSKKPTVYNCCKFDTPEGAIEDGFIRNREILSVATKEALTKAGMKNNNNVIFSITSSKIANREVNLPLVAENKIQPLIQSNAKDYFPVDIDEYVITYKLLEKMVTDNEKTMRLMVLAAPSTLIESYYDFAQLMGFNIVAIDYVGNSCYQIMKKQTGSGVNVVVQLNEQSTLINVLDGEILALQRTVPYGANNIIEAAMNCGEFDIVDRASAMDKLFNEPLINAKLNESVIDDVATTYMENNDDSYALQLREMKAKDDITETFNYLISNVVRVLDYYVAKNPSKKVSAVHLSGIGSRIKGIGHLFKNEIFIDVNKFENVLGAEFSRASGVRDVEKSDYMVVIGASMEPVDFIPKEHVLKNQKKNEAKGAALIFIGCVGVAALIIIVSLAFNIMAKSKKKSLENDISGYSDIVKLCDERDAIEIKKYNAEQVYVNTMGINSTFNIFLEELEATLPQKVIVDGITSNDTGVNLNLTASSWEQVGETVIQLNKCALIDSVEISSISNSISDIGLATFKFSAKCTMVPLDYSNFVQENPTEELIRKIVNPQENDKAADASAEPEKSTESEGTDASAAPEGTDVSAAPDASAAPETSTAPEGTDASAAPETTDKSAKPKESDASAEPKESDANAEPKESATPSNKAADTPATNNKSTNNR